MNQIRTRNRWVYWQVQRSQCLLLNVNLSFVEDIINKKAFQYDAYHPLVDCCVQGGCVSPCGEGVYPGCVCVYPGCVCVQGVCPERVVSSRCQGTPPGPRDTPHRPIGRHTPSPTPRGRHTPLPYLQANKPSPPHPEAYTPLSHTYRQTNPPLHPEADTAPWTEGMTHTCENITFPQLLLRGVKIGFHGKLSASGME